MKLRCVTRLVDSVVRPETGEMVWWRDDSGFIAWDPLIRIEVPAGSRRFATVAEQLEETFSAMEIEDDVDLPGTGPIAFAAFSFDEFSRSGDVLIPSRVMGKGEGKVWMTTIDRVETEVSPGAVDEAGTIPRMHIRSDEDSQQEWKNGVRKALKEILNGSLEKVVLARFRDLEAAGPIPASVVLSNLISAQPGCFAYRFENLVGSSPELLVRRLGRWVDSIPLAGSSARGETPSEDEELGRALLNSEKDLNEHRLTVRSVSTSLETLCDSLSVEESPFLYLLPNVQHLGTKIQGRLAPENVHSALDLAGILHPTAAVCGAPTKRAMDFIREYEGFDRGLYSGPIGWVDSRGDGEFAIALRCAEIYGANARVFAGAGIVAGSDPETELEETALKMRAVMKAVGASD